MYEFIDINDYQENLYPSIQTVVDGINLDHEIDGFRTLSVSNRSLIGRDVETLKFVARGYKDKVANRIREDKSAYVNTFITSDLQGILIKVKYKLEANSNEEFRERLSYLAHCLQKEQVKFIWTDDPEYYYIGTVTDYDEPEEFSNKIVASFSVFMTDPRKTYILPLKAENQNVTKDTIIFHTRFEMFELESFKITLKESTNKLIVKNQSQNLALILTREFKAGDTFTYESENFIKLNGLNAMIYLDLESNLEEFNVQENDEITFSAPCDYEMNIISKRF